MSETTESVDREQAKRLLEQGLAVAGMIGNPVARQRHRASWALRLSALDPERAAGMAEDLDDPEARTRLLLTVTMDRALRGDTDLAELFSRVLAAAETTGADTRLKVVNSLCEIAIEVAEKDRDAALRQLHLLVPVVRGLEGPGPEFRQLRALGSALVGEALLVLQDSLGRELLADAEREAAELPARDAIMVFIANALAPREPEYALILLESVQDPAARMDARLQATAVVGDDAIRDRLFEQAEADAWIIEHYHGPEVLVRLATVLGVVHPERAAELFRKALAGADSGGPQMRSLQWTGVASALAGIDRDWSLRVFRDAQQAASEEEDLMRRVTTLALIANEMAEPFPREAAEVFARAMAEAQELDAMWEFAHLNDVVFRSDRSEFLDVTPAIPVLEKALARLSDDDPRIPGVFGLPEIAQSLAQVAPRRAEEVLERWLRSAEAAGDTDAMTQAALAISRSNPERARAALTAVRDLVLRRVDCPSMGSFARSASDMAPDLVLSVAPHIPDPRERADAMAVAAVGLYATDPERSLALINELERPVDRSLALMQVVDRLLNTGDRAEPQPLLEDLP